jgi:hypothetical protein
MTRKAWLAMGIAMALGTAQAQEGRDVAVGTHLAPGTGYVSIARFDNTPDKDPRHLLMVFEQDGMGGIPLWESRDGGGHWTHLMDVTDQAHKGNAKWQLRWQPHLMRMQRASGGLAAGTLILSANATGNDEHRHVATQDLQVYASTDAGKTWTYRGSVIKGGGNPSDKDNKGVWETNIHVLDDGRMVAYYSSEQHKAEGYNQVLAHKLSTDGGKTWGKEVLDVAIPGGVERPGMAVVERLGDGRYAMTYENIDGPQNGQVQIKFSRDGLDWGDPQRHGDPVITQSGAWPAACPVIRWFPVGGPEGVIVVSAERAGGGGDEGGRALYFNNASGRGPWWEVRAPVQKLTGNIHAGWTQALLQLDDGKFLHVTSSSSPQDPASPKFNEILYNATPLRFDRFEAEDAAMTNAVQVPDSRASNLRKARLGAGSQGRLRFEVNATAGAHTLRLVYADVGIASTPTLRVNGAAQPAATTAAKATGWNVLTVKAPLLPGFNTIDVDGAAYVLDVDYLQVDGDDDVP